MDIAYEGILLVKPGFPLKANIIICFLGEHFKLLLWHLGRPNSLIGSYNQQQMRIN